MRQVRHDTGIDLPQMKAFSEGERSLIDAYLGGMRVEPDALRLSILGGILRRAYRSGDQLGLDAAVIAKSIRLAAEVQVAIQVLSAPGKERREFRLGDGPSAIAGPIPAEFNHAGNWMGAWKLSIVGRQQYLVDRLIPLADHLYAGPELNIPEVTSQAVQLFRATVTDADPTRHPAFGWTRDYVASCTEKSAHGRAVRAFSGLELSLIEHLTRRDGGAFERTLVEYLKRHEKHWSATDQRRKDPEGFLAEGAIWLAALAWDRGLRFHIESDYLPWSWVTGELFRTPFAAEGAQG